MSNDFNDAAYRLACWFRSRNVSDADEVAVEVRFPTERAACQARMALWKEISPMLISDGSRANPDLSKPFRVCGLKVTFTAPSSANARRP